MGILEAGGGAGRGWNWVGGMIGPSWWWDSAVVSNAGSNALPCVGQPDMWKLGSPPAKQPIKIQGVLLHRSGLSPKETPAAAVDLAGCNGSHCAPASPTGAGLLRIGLSFCPTLRGQEVGAIQE